MKLQGVIFDLDGVITDSAHLHFQAWQQIAAEICISIDVVVCHPICKCVSFLHC